MRVGRIEANELGFVNTLQSLIEVIALCWRAKYKASAMVVTSGIRAAYFSERIYSWSLRRFFMLALASYMRASAAAMHASNGSALELRKA